MKTKQIIKSINTITVELSKIKRVLEKTQINVNPPIKVKSDVIYDDFDEYIKRIIRNGGL